MFQWIRNLFGRKPMTAERSNGIRPRSYYDSAQTNDDNRRHWAWSDGLSALAANSLAVRKRLRERARYELANNSYARGIVDTKSNHIIGTGPRLQMMTSSQEFNRKVNEEFMAWARAVCLADKLRTMAKSRAGDGEAFAIFTTNKKLLTPVRLDVKLIECDQFTTPQLAIRNLTSRILWTDGIEFDEDGNPTKYHLLKNHPGDQFQLAWEFDELEAERVIHWFRRDRPGQVRGIPEITPALSLFAQLRRYTQAVIAAAETAADFAGVLKSTSSADTEETVEIPGLEIEKRMLVSLPRNHELQQLRAEQPCTTYGEFVERILNEIARCLQMPLNIAMCNSSKYNYASGRLDHQTYFQSIDVDQVDCETVVLCRILTAWLDEAVLIPGYLPAADLGSATYWPHRWFWQGLPHVDPVKEATAQQIQLASNTTTLADEWAAQGSDWEEKLEQRALELRRMKELGITPEQAAPAKKPDAAEDDNGDSPKRPAEDDAEDPADKENAAA